MNKRKNKIQCAMFNRFYFDMPLDAVKDCHHQGACDSDIEHWQPKINLSHISDSDLYEELKEQGAWEHDELQDRTTNEQKIIWIAAGNIQDEWNENEN